MEELIKKKLKFVLLKKTARKRAQETPCTGVTAGFAMHVLWGLSVILGLREHNFFISFFGAVTVQVWDVQWAEHPQKIN